jgi:hypothetical protein
MSEKTWIEQVVEKVVSEVLEARVPPLRSELVRRVLEEVTPHLGAAPESSPASLLKAISSIQTGTTQREILRTLLDNASRYCGRVALFVVKAGAATGWQGRAFSNHEEIKDFPLDVSSGAAARAMQSRLALAASAAEVDPKFISRFGAPAEDHALLLPLLLKDRVAALVYADAGTEAGGKMEGAALELLVVSASAWLEVTALRKQAQKEGPAEARSFEKTPAPAPPVPASPSFSDPFAAHAPAHSPVAAPEPPAAEPVDAVSTMSEPVPAAAAAATATAVAVDTFAALSTEDADLHRKAQRFARLLVDEIKLYNQAKVAEGRKNKDLYDRLKEDIDKSQATYQKRFGATIAASAEYFNQELVRSLAEDDSSVMGANFQR